MIRPKNNLGDILALLVYHVVVGVVTTGLIVSLRHKLPLTDIRALFAIMTGQSSEGAHRIDKRIFVRLVSGDVTVSRQSFFNQNKPRPDDILSEDDVLHLGPQGSLLLTFEDGFSWRVRAGADTELRIGKIRGLDQTTKRENTTLELIKGSLQLHPVSNGRDATLTIKAPFLNFVSRDAMAVVVTDGKEYTLGIVNEGSLEVENFVSFKKDSLTGKQGYVSDKTGLVRIFENPEIQNLYSWNLTDERPLPSLENILKLSGLPKHDSPVETETTMATSGDDTLKQLFQEKWQAFKTSHEELQQEIIEATEKLKETQLRLDQVRGKIFSDIRCLEAASGVCSLYSEKLLIERGYPKTSGPPHLMRSMAADLKLFLQEKEKEISDAKVTLSSLQASYLKQESTLKDVEDGLKKNTDLRTLIDRLAAFVRP